LGEYTAEVKFALGLTELRPNEPAYLVEGIKDCLILLAKGYNAFTLGGVQHRLQPSVVKRLQENGNSLNIVFDTDFAGISAAQKLSSTLKTQHSTLNTQHFILPRLERQETKDAPKPAKNDLADYVCQYGFDDELTNVLVSPAPLRSITLTKASLQIPAWELSVQSKIMEDAHTLKALTNLVASASRLVLRAPTGCGKTYTVLRHIAPEHYKKTGGVTVLAVPTVAMAEQIKNEYHDLKPIVITGNESDLHRLYADEPLDTCIIISVYDSASRLLDIISEKNTLLVVDEMHKLVSDYNYRTSAVRIMLCLIKQAHRVLALSATPELLFHEAPLNFTYCTIKVEQERPLHVHTRTYDKRDAAVLATIRDILHRHPSTTILLNVNSKKLLRRTKILLMKSGLPESAVDIVTRDTMDTSPEYRAATEQSRFTRPVILSTNVLDCGVNILNEGRAHVIMVDEKNEDTVIQVANRFRKAEIIDVTLLYAKNKGNKEQETNDQATNAPMTNDQETNDQSPIFNEKYHFLQAQFSAQMTAEAFNHAAGRNVSAECVTHRLGRKSNATLSDSMIHFEHRHHRWATDECAIMNRIHTLRLAMKTIEDVIKALEAYGFVHVVDKPLTDMSPLAPEIIAEVREEMRQEEREREETILQMLETKTTYFLAALNTFSRSKALKSALPRICPASLMPLVKQHPETEAIIAQHAELLRELRTETMVRYYTEARDLGFDHAEAIHLVRQNSDPRKWASFTDRLPIKQREAISLNGLTDSVLSKHDREKLRREEEIRRMIANTAQQGCTITGSNGIPRHIPNALRTKKEIAERANAYTGIMFRMTQQQAGEMVNALFYVHYVRERVKTDHGTRFSGHYAFENDGTELRRKTLAEFVSEYGVDGATYERLFMEQVREEAQRYEEAQERALRYETVE
jgi:superfamily II DNA or RNA helicase